LICLGAALDAVERWRYDLILMDCQMPEMDGCEATAELRRRERGGRRIPVIALTASAMETDRERCLVSGMDDFLTKPLRSAEVVAHIDRWLEEPKLEDESPASERTRESTLDAEGFAALLELAAGDDEFLDELVGTYTKQGEELLGLAESAALLSTTQDFSSAVHALGGSGRNMGATRLADRCRKIEEQIALGTTDRALTDLVPLLRRELGEASAAIQRERLMVSTETQLGRLAMDLVYPARLK
jgi:response regulator RpfG family c-di-GMP phosphodiesterase